MCSYQEPWFLSCIPYDVCLETSLKTHKTVAKMISELKTSFSGLHMTTIRDSRKRFCLEQPLYSWHFSARNRQRNKHAELKYLNKDNGPFHSCVLSCLGMNASEAGGDLL